MGDDAPLYSRASRIGQLAAVLEEQKIDVRIVACTALNIRRQALAEAIRQEQPDIVGTTALTPFLI
jgi:hypothetical protein